MAKNTSVTLQCTVDRFESGLVVLGFSRDQHLTIAKKYLPRGIKVGDYLRVEFLTDELAAKRREHLARAMLEEIFNGK